MNRINTIFTLYSVTVLLIIVERLLPFTRGFFQPYNFMQVHQLIQTVVFIPITVVLSFLAMKIITNDFHELKEKGNTLLVGLFVLGAYFYGAGEGLHEIAIVTLHKYCGHLLNNLCNGLFINSYYTGNIIFFIGGILMSVSLLVLAKKIPANPFSQKELIILSINSIVYAFTWFAYAAFDTVSVGIFFSSLLMIISLTFFITIRKKWKSYPYILYSAIAYSLATIATLIIRFF